MNTKLKRHAFRTLLAFHFLGLALTIGVRFALFVVDRETSGGLLQSLTFGRDLSAAIARSLALPGILITIVTGIAMVLLRYGRRPPVWVWMKVGLTTAALGIAVSGVAPALSAARDWAHWSVAHGLLAPQFQENVARASLFGAVVFTLFLFNIPVAVWKPFLSATVRKPIPPAIMNANSPATPADGQDQTTTSDAADTHATPQQTPDQNQTTPAQ